MKASVSKKCMVLIAVLTAISATMYVTGCGKGAEGSADSIKLNGHSLYVNGVEYTEGSASEGEAIELTVSSGSGSGYHDGAGTPPAKPGEN